MGNISALQIYQRLSGAYGAQHWWPADSPFEVMVGAILTQNTNWRNVEKAIANLKAANMLSGKAIAACQRDQLAELIRPSGFFRQKAERLQLFCQFYLESGQDRALKEMALGSLREQLLKLHGIGPETADSMLLYALDKPAFVVDAYTRRIFTRLGLLAEPLTYAAIQRYFEQQLTASLSLYQEYHALIVEHAKRHCRVRPDCLCCPLAELCATAASLPVRNG